jgi:hypothetical protein
MKKLRTCTIPSLFVSSCNNTKAADEKRVGKIAVVAVDSVKKSNRHC